MSEQTNNRDREYYAENRERILAQKKDYYVRTRDSKLEYNKKYYEKHKDAASSYGREYHAKNREKHLLQMKQWDKNNTARRNAAKVRDYAANPWRKLLREAKTRAKNKGIEYSLSAKWAISVWAGKCDLTGLTFVTGPGRPGPFSPSIDRIDTSKGYTPENSRFILFRVNCLKGDDANDANALLIANALISNNANR